MQKIRHLRLVDELSVQSDFQEKAQLEESIEDRHALAQDILIEMIDQGLSPVFSIKKDYLYNQKALIPRKTWINEQVLAGVIGRKPYNPENDRILIKINPKKSKIKLTPRLTGANKTFSGVVVSHAPILLDDSVELFDSKTGLNTSLSKINQELDIQNLQQDTAQRAMSKIA